MFSRRSSPNWTTFLAWHDGQVSEERDSGTSNRDRKKPGEIHAGNQGIAPGRNPPSGRRTSERSAEWLCAGFAVTLMVLTQAFGILPGACLEIGSCHMIEPENPPKSP
jgi:hypothetical protein